MLNVIKTNANELYLTEDDPIQKAGIIRLDTDKTFNFFIEVKPDEDKKQMTIYYSFSKCNGNPLYLKTLNFNYDNIIYMGEIKDNCEITKALENFKLNYKE